MKKLILPILLIALLTSCTSPLGRMNFVSGDDSVLLSGESFSGKKEVTISLDKESSVSMTLATGSGELVVKATAPDGSTPLEGKYSKDWNKYGTVVFSLPQGDTLLTLEGKKFTGSASFSW